jgi:hypothetical protein
VTDAQDWEHSWRRANVDLDASTVRAHRLALHPTVREGLVPAICDVLLRVDLRLNRPDRLDLIHLGPGGAGLAHDVRHALPADQAARLVVEPMRSRPCNGVLLTVGALELIPTPVMSVIDDTVHRLTITREGMERPGPNASEEEQIWLRRWWPLWMTGARAEIGIPRDQRWRDLVSMVRLGVAIGVEFGHTRTRRRSGHYLGGSLTAHRDGRQVAPVPDRTRVLSAAVAVDSCAEAAGDLAEATCYGELVGPVSSRRAYWFAHSVGLGPEVLS